MATIFKEWTFAEMMHLLRQFHFNAFVIIHSAIFQRVASLGMWIYKYTQSDLILILSDSKSEITLDIQPCLG